MVEACTGTAPVVAWWASEVTCSPPAADSRLTGFAWVSSDRFWGRNRFVTRLGVLPAEVLANRKLPPSREVMGIVPDARAETQQIHIIHLQCNGWMDGGARMGDWGFLIITYIMGWVTVMDIVMWFFLFQFTLYGSQCTVVHERRAQRSSKPTRSQTEIGPPGDKADIAFISTLKHMSNFERLSNS